MRTLSFLILLLPLYACDSDSAGEQEDVREVVVDLEGESSDAASAEEGEGGGGPLDRPPASGSWYYRDTPTGGVVMFGEPETEPWFSVRCDGEMVHFDHAGGADMEGTVQMTIYTSLGNTHIDASPVGTELPLLRASLPAGDSWVIRLADATGTIAVALEEGAPLVMPHSEHLSRLLRECGRLGAGDQLPIDPEATPETVIREYYAAIRRGDYRLAYRLWNDNGRASGQTYRAFASGFENTATTSVTIGAPSGIEGAAGSQFITLPVEIDAVTRDGKEQRFRGNYRLKRILVDGAGAEGRAWRIYSADIEEIEN